MTITLVIGSSYRHMPTDLDISFVEVRDENVEQLKVLNRAIFPINYQVNQGSVCGSARPSSAVRHSHSACAPSQDRVYKDILASGQVTQLGASAKAPQEVRDVMPSCPEDPCACSLPH